MENTTNNSFEEQWQNAFDDASLPPSEAVWERIEVGLENNIPPKSGNNSYYIGAISVVILSIGIWFFMSKKEGQKQAQIIENKIVIPKENIEKVESKVEEKLIIKPKENTQVKKAIVIEKQENIQSDVIVEDITEPENQERAITNSIDFISPIMATKKISSELTNPTINAPFENTPYYETPKLKTKKKSIWDKVRISGRIGIYQ